MTLEELLKNCDDNNLQKYISILKPYSLYENTEKKLIQSLISRIEIGYRIIV